MNKKPIDSKELASLVRRCCAPLGAVLMLGFGLASPLHALPIGFGTHQGDLDYNEISSPNFRVFHDARVPHEGAMTLNALEAAKPVVEGWLGVKRSSALPVISSAVTSNASFANFITDAIELQTLGQGERDLFWHEFVHSTMYGHFKNWLGPTGAILHLPWMPAWFIEGLAEALTVSVGSDMQASIERYQALTNWWPSYDRLHSLYGAGNFFLRGYSTAGGLTAWILRQAKGRSLPQMLSGFYDYTYPQYFFWSLNPFSDFMPFDEALTDFNKKSGEKAYLAYQKAARSHWLKHARGPFLVAERSPRLPLTGLPPIGSDGQAAYLVLGDGENRRRMRLAFDAQTGWLTSLKPGRLTMPDHGYSQVYYSREGLHLGINHERDVKTGRDSEAIVRLTTHGKDKASSVQATVVKPQGSVEGIFESAEDIIWLERDLEMTRLCQLPKKRLRGKLPISRRQVSCPLTVQLPKTMTVLGERRNPFPRIGIFPAATRNEPLSVEIWLHVREQTLAGDRSRVLVWDTAKKTLRQVEYNGGGTALSFATAGRGQWLLVAEHNRRSLRQISNDGRCLGVFDLEDLPLQMTGLDDGGVVLGLYQGALRSIIKLSPQRLQAGLKPCRPARGHTSPLLWAMRQEGGRATLDEALAQASLWRDDAGEAERQALHNALTLANPLDRAPPPRGGGKAYLAEDSKPASWSPRPVFAVPWIGADDALGTQLGILSVPLMDIRQNETLRLSLLYGLASRYPNTELTLDSTRFWPGLSASVYRRQVWDGTWYSRALRGYEALYLDEKGARFEVSYPWHFWDSSFTLALGMRMGTLSPFLGKLAMVKGRINEPYLQADFRHQLGRVSLSAGLRARSAPAALNSNFNYNVVSGNLNLGFGLPFLSSHLSLGLEASRTRGEKGKTPNLKEYYQPLKTFVAGSGGGYNKNSFNLLGDSALFATTYGDTQGRSKINWTMPVIADVDKQLWLFYFQSLNFSAFYNYGGAWFQGDDYQKFMIKAHGYNLDLLFENKGVSFNASLGSGQVIGHNFQLYVTFGFDAFL